MSHAIHIWVPKLMRVIAAVAALSLGFVSFAHGATNTAIPDGGGFTINASAPVTVNSVLLSLVTRARDLTGAVLADGNTISPGQDIYFVLYVDNTTSAVGYDVRLTDNLNEAQFTYVPNSLAMTTVPSGSNDAAIWAGTWTPLTDAVGGPDDLASAQDTVAPAGVDKITTGLVTNQVVNIPGNTLQAFRFRVTVK